jgi:hypothetical protein
LFGVTPYFFKGILIGLIINADVTDEELKQLEKLQMVSFERFLGKKYRLYLPNTGKADERQLKFYIKTVS